eukprot:10856-Heterococcus_DN1.PRE.1
MFTYCVSVCMTTSGTRSEFQGTALNHADTLSNRLTTMTLTDVLKELPAAEGSSTASRSSTIYHATASSMISMILAVAIVALSALLLHALQWYPLEVVKPSSHTAQSVGVRCKQYRKQAEQFAVC